MNKSMMIIGFVGLGLLLSACGHDVNNYYTYVVGQAGETAERPEPSLESAGAGAAVESVSAQAGSAGSVQGSGSGQISVEAGAGGEGGGEAVVDADAGSAGMPADVADAPEDAEPEDVAEEVEPTTEQTAPVVDSKPWSCTLDQVRDFGVAYQSNALVGGPNGFLFGWFSSWDADANVQTFDPYGEPLADPAILTESSYGLRDIVGTEEGYLLHVLGSQSRILRTDPSGNILHALDRGRWPNRTSLSVGDPQEIFVESATSAMTDPDDGYQSIIHLYQVRPDATLHSTRTFVYDGLAMGETYTAAGVAQNGSKIGSVLEHDMRHDNGGIIRTFEFLVYDMDLDRFQTTRFKGATTGYSSPFIMSVQSAGDGFAVVWGSNDVSAYTRYISYVKSDGVLGLTYELPMAPAYLSDIKVIDNGEKIIAGAYDDVTQERSFRIFSATGELETVLPISSGRNYYLGRVQVAAAGNGQFAAVWTAEDSETYETAFQAAFISCVSE